MTSEETQNAIVSEFEALDGWEARYEKIIQIGKDLPALEEEHKVAKNIVKGCQSQVWLVAALEGDKLVLRADSDAMIVRGLVALLMRVYSGLTPQEILETKPVFIEKLGFKNNLSASRANGLNSMIKQIHYYALAFQAMLSAKK